MVLVPTPNSLSTPSAKLRNARQRGPLENTMPTVGTKTQELSVPGPGAGPPLSGRLIALLFPQTMFRPPELSPPLPFSSGLLFKGFGIESSVGCIKSLD